MRRIALTITVISAIAAAMMLANGAGAQNVVVPGTSMAQEQAALLTAREQAKAARMRSAQLEMDARTATQEADRASRRAAALAARIQESEADIAAAQARIAIIARLQKAQTARLVARQEPVMRLTAALQVLARRPPALALVQPGSISDAVHVRSVLSAVLPVIRARTADLRAELARSRELRAGAEQAAQSLRDSRTQLAARQTELRQTEARQRMASRTLRDSSAFESDRAIALGEEARDIVDLMDQLRVAGDVRAQLASLPGPSMRPDDLNSVAIPAAESRSFRLGAPPYRLPVVGALVTGLGEVSRSGARARGLTIATQAGAQAIAPASGRVSFAGPYRGYGRIVIIDHGGGWSSLITSMERLSVRVGDSVNQGDPVGSARGAKPRVTVELRRHGRPIDIIPLLGA